MKNLLMVAGIFSMLLISCSSSKITHAWQAKNGVASTYSKIMVVALMKDNDAAMREKMENHLVGDLADRGHTALSGMKEYGPKYFENMNEPDVIKKLAESGVDAVITVVLLDKSRETYYVPGQVYQTPYVIYHNRFWGYYATMVERTRTPGYYQTDTRYFLESNLYDLKTKQLKASIQTRSFNPASMDGLGHEYGLLIVKKMSDMGLLNKTTKP